MDAPGQPDLREEQHARIRRAKQLLRYMPRRAVMHKYPLIGRFAAIARRREHLWSFRREYVTPALYGGPILSLLPLMGLHLPLALLLSLILRTNFMVFGLLQFITNPFTIGPIYYGTYHLGRAVIEVSGLGTAPAPDPLGKQLTATDPLPPPGLTETPDEPPREIKWTKRFSTTVNALMLGGVIAGGAVGLVLDVLWRLGVRQAQRHRDKVLERRLGSGSTHGRPPPK
ncbi:MAG: hypothetical protein A3G75_11370 [Verrucomicrobia bacterium RIFCSPLOWO2_12_FULL_64_8]|nr:MAG: hypothetical protein A3G75_11370 [Verrucomicrobia bacterium RIFCSPLOWO2_12_FULL_64_8]